MSLKSSFVTLFFVLLAVISTLLYATPASRFWLETHVTLPPDVLMAGVLAIITFLSLAAGGNRPMIAIISTLAIFIVITMAQAPPIRYMTLAALLFSIGFYGMVVSRNAVRVLISIELMLNAVNINFVTLACYVDPATLKGQVFAIFILTVAAAEAAVGLAIVLALYRNNATVDMENFSKLRG